MADILIKGLELPTEERISLSIYPNGIVVNHSTLKVEKNRTTAIEIPPHGRLGDLDKVANRMHRYAMACRKNGNPEGAELWRYAEEEVRLQGTVVEASTEGE